jgi:hypothetical protein
MIRRLGGLQAAGPRESAGHEDVDDGATTIVISPGHVAFDGEIAFVQANGLVGRLITGQGQMISDRRA